MKRLISVLMTVIVILSFTACGQNQNKIQVVNNEQPIAVEKLDIPMELQGYKNIYLKSFDGQYAVFTVDREITIGDTQFYGETGKIIVYDVKNKHVVHSVMTNFPSGRVRRAVKEGDNLYFTVYYGYLGEKEKEELYLNNGLENKLLDEYTISTSVVDYSDLIKIEDKLYLERNYGGVSERDSEIFLIDGEKLESLGGFEAENQGLIEFEGYEDGQLIISEIELNDDGYIYFNKWTGDEKESIFRLKNEHGHSFQQLENMFIHPVDSLDNSNSYKMMAVTDLENKNVTEIGMMQGGFFDNYKNKGLMYTYGESEEQILLFESKDNVLEITPVNIDVKGKNNHSYFMTENNALLEIGTMGESEFELYLIEY